MGQREHRRVLPLLFIRRERILFAMAFESWYTDENQRARRAGRMSLRSEFMRGSSDRMKRCFIFAAGTFYGLRERPAAGDLVIAADAGYLTCRKAGIVPDLLLGDFDSMDIPADAEHLVRLPVEKDDTDTLAAVRLALERGCDTVYIYGGTGGKRLDHTLANLQTLLFLRRRGARGWLYDDDFVWTAIENEDIDETGFQYPLEHAALTPDFPVGVSNHILEPRATITVRRGALAVGWQLPPLSER